MTDPARGSDRSRWEARYDSLDRETGGSTHQPSAWVVERSLGLPGDSVILDLACGTGRHARALASGGRLIIAVDFIERAVKRTASGEPRIHGVVADAAALPFGEGTLDAIICVSFLDRALFPHLIGLLRRGGWLVYETFTVAHRHLVTEGRSRGPTNDAYLLALGELPSLVSPLAVREHSEGLVMDEAGVRHVARVVAVRWD